MGRPSKTKKETAKKETAVTEVVQVAAEQQAETPVKEVRTVVAEKPARKMIDSDMEVEVQSNFAGSLIYISKKTSEKFVWSRLGDSNWMTVEELITMRNTQRAFFENNWIKIVGEDADDIIKHLRLEKYFNEFIDLTELGVLLELDADEIVAKITPMKREIKDALASAAVQMIEDGELTNLKAIRALEKAIGYALLEN